MDALTAWVHVISISDDPESTANYLLEVANCRFCVHKFVNSKEAAANAIKATKCVQVSRTNAILSKLSIPRKRLPPYASPFAIYKLVVAPRESMPVADPDVFFCNATKGVVKIKGDVMDVVDIIIPPIRLRRNTYQGKPDISMSRLVPNLCGNDKKYQTMLSATLAAASRSVQFKKHADKLLDCDQIRLVISKIYESTQADYKKRVIGAIYSHFGVLCKCRRIDVETVVVPLYLAGFGTQAIVQS